MVYEENLQRRDALLKAKKEGTTGPAGADNETELEKQNEIDRANEHVLSLNHIHSLSKEEAMLELVKYPGIGPKTAACVILFCLQRPCFAVDTHIFRITKWLGWIPSEKVDEVKAFSHLEVRIPDHLKYSLHQLFIRHGKSCPRCRAITGENSDGWDEGCVIDHLVKRTGKRKGAPEPAPKAKNKKSRGGKQDGEDTD
jgi:endonuclease III